MKSPIDSDVRDDRARDLVLGLLRDVADAQQEVMMVISQLGFGHYLNKPCYSTAAHYFPRAVDLDQKYRQGDFDVLIIHAKHGLMLGQIKSVGAIFDSLEMTVKEEEEKVLKKVKLAVSQLIKAKTVLEHLVKDFSMDFHVTRTMLLPYIDSSLLAKVVKSSPEFEKVNMIFSPLFSFDTLTCIALTFIFILRYGCSISILCTIRRIIFFQISLFFFEFMYF